MSPALKTGQRLGKFRLPSVGGTWKQLSDFVGRPSVFCLWAPWHASRSVLQEMKALPGAVGIAFDVGGPAQVMNKIVEADVSTPHLLDNACHLARAWGVQDLPVKVWIDGSGTIAKLEGAVCSERAIDPKFEILMQHVTNLLGRQRTSEAVETLKAALALDPTNKIVEAQLRVVQGA